MRGWIATVESAAHAEIVPQPGSRIRAAYAQQVAHFKPYHEHTLAMPYLAMLADRTPAGQPPGDPRMTAPCAPKFSPLAAG